MAATDERAECRDDAPSDAEMLPLEEVETPGTSTIEAVAEYLGLEKRQTIKALLYEIYDDDGAVTEYVAAFIRGDHEANLVKICNALGIAEHAIAFADEHKMAEATGCVGGFTGPVGLKNCRIIVDSELTGMKNMCAGANHADHHFINMNYGRDYKADLVVNFKMIEEGDPCPVCGAPVKMTRGIEVGQVFKLGTKYSRAMGAVYKDENMQEHEILMGCYGIGVTRTMAAIVEQNYDEDGILWPVAVAPYHVIITVMKTKDEEQMRIAEEIESALEKQGIEVMLDDRDERPGVKFKDADLLGIPVRITVGRRAGEGIVEYKLRRESEKIELPAEEAIAKAADFIHGELEAHSHEAVMNL